MPAPILHLPNCRDGAGVCDNLLFLPPGVPHPPTALPPHPQPRPRHTESAPEPRPLRDDAVLTHTGQGQRLGPARLRKLIDGAQAARAPQRATSVRTPPATRGAGVWE